MKMQKGWSLPVLVAFVLMITVSFAHADLNYGLLAYYPFNGNANDESGNGNNGIVNGATLTTDMHGNANSAYNFDGNTTNHIVVLNPNNLEPNQEITMAFFIKAFSGGNRISTLLRKAGSFDNGYNFTWNQNYNNQLELRLV